MLRYFLRNLRDLEKGKVGLMNGRGFSTWCTGVTFRCATIFQGVHTWNICLSTLLGCAVRHLACTVQAMMHTGMEQVFAFAHVGLWNIVQARMLQRVL